jgi:hypothetical protein
MRVYLEEKKKRNMASTDVTPTHGTVLEHVREAEGVGHKLFMDNHFISPKLFNTEITVAARCKT